MISEKDMEEQIAKYPEKFLGERGLVVVERQYRIGSYIFDLIFKDKHGAKLIVEIQKGTLDRNHTYKILDYYDEYRESNPNEFIEIMVVANQISAERKKRLHSLGVEFRELPVLLFESVVTSESTDEDSIPQKKKQTQASSSVEQNDSLLVGSESVSYHFKSLGQSAFINAVRDSITSSSESQKWQIGGDSSLTAIFLPANAAIEKKFGRGLKVQIWMERPKAGKGTCKIEVAYRIRKLSVEENKALREKIASSIRSHLITQLPEAIKLSEGSTVAACYLDLPGIKDVADDTKENSDRYASEIQQVFVFFKFLDISLTEWAVNKLETIS